MVRSIGTGSVVAGAGALLAASYLLARPRVRDAAARGPSR
jgi:hypothetical protein